ncbi:MAG: hypothetical protein QM606_03540 [Leucobacter sp.]
MVDAPPIDFTTRGVRIGDTSYDPVPISALISAFGEPARPEPRAPEDGAEPSKNRWLVWDELGIRASTSDLAFATGIEVNIVDDPGVRADVKPEMRKYFASGVYAGTVTVKGAPPLEAVPAKALDSAWLFLKVKLGDWQLHLDLDSSVHAQLEAMPFTERFRRIDSGENAALVRSAEHPIVGIAAFKPSKPPKPSGKYKLQPAVEPAIEAKSFPWRLAIIQQLMYEDDALEPRFDVHEFAADQGARSFDPYSFDMQVIPSVRNWFKKLPVPTRLAERIETLTLDGGNDIYLQLIPAWDGEDETFMIKTLTDADLDLLPNLRNVEDIAGFLGPRARKALEARGVTVEG